MALLNTVLLQGTHAARPAAASTNTAYLYYETDTQTLFQSTGAAWTQIAASVGASTLGTLGYAQITANQAGITTKADVTGLSVTVTVGSGRRVRISAFCTAITGTLGNAGWFIMEGATQLAQADLPAFLTPHAAYNTFAWVTAVVTPSAGSHTYKVQAVNDGTGNAATVNAGATFPSYILVEDIGT